MDNNKSVFDILSEVNVNQHIEHKNGLTYLSWAYAWSETKKRFPNATYKIYETDQGCIYHTDGKTCWVKTGVTIHQLEHIEYLPVMDYRNQSIPLEKVTSFDVNKSIQRSLTKALARHGLGLYIYAGEDLPEGDIKIKSSDVKILQNLIKETKDPKQFYHSILSNYGIFDLKELTIKNYTEVLKKIKKDSSIENTNLISRPDL